MSTLDPNTLYGDTYSTETTPLLHHDYDNHDDLASFKSDEEQEHQRHLLLLNSASPSSSASASGNKNKNNTQKQQTKRKWQKLAAFAIVGVLFTIAFNLVFLPRTSLARDLKRLHFDRLTKADVKRIYLNSFSSSSGGSGGSDDDDDDAAKLAFQRHAEQYAALSDCHHRNNVDNYEDNLKESLLKYTVNQFKSFGYRDKDIALDTYRVWLNRPNFTELQLINEDGKVVYQPSLREDANTKEPKKDSSESANSNNVPLDHHGKNNSKNHDGSQAFHGYSPSGNVTAPYIFANYGTIEDFEYISKIAKINTTNTIAIIRNGGNLLKAYKIKNAERYGVKAVILFTDPVVDNNFTERNGYDSFPKGPLRNPMSFEKGSVLYFADIPGDPSTPYFAIKPDVGNDNKRNHKQQHGKNNNNAGNYSMPRIPSIPISAAEVEPILAKLNGMQPNWTSGNLEKFDYSIGPSNGHYQLKLVSLQDYSKRPISNVIVKIPGILANEGIMIGAHRDSWPTGTGTGTGHNQSSASGFSDAYAGLSILLEISRSMHRLVELGWKPLRTVYFVSWDATEYGMVGSTEFGEFQSNKIQKQILSYINLDNAISGSRFAVSANHLFESLIFKTAEQVGFDRELSLSLMDYWKGQSGPGSKPKIDLIGGGNDCAVFQNHLAIPSIDVGFRNDEGINDPVYHHHSKFDNLQWMQQFVDQGFKLHEVLAKFTGLLLINLNEREMIDYKISDFARVLKHNFAEITQGKQQQQQQQHKDTINKWINDDKTIISKEYVNNLFDNAENKYYTHFLKMVATASDSTLRNGTLWFDKTPPSFKFRHLLNYTVLQIANFANVSTEFDTRMSLLQQEIINDYAWFNYYKKLILLIKIKYYDVQLKQFDKQFLYNEGLPLRPWMRYVLVAPKRESGLVGQYLPGLAEGIDDEKMEMVVKWLVVLSKCLNDALVLF